MRIRNNNLIIAVFIFNYIIYYVKNKNKNYWYKNEIPFFRFHLIKK